MARRANIGPLGSTLLLILVILFSFSGAEDTTEYFEGLLDTTVQDTETIEVTTEKSVRNSSSNPYAKYIFGLPPIPIDPSIPGVESDDDFEKLTPFTPDQVYGKAWYLTGFDKENCPIFFRKTPRTSDQALKQSSNSTVLKLIDKLARYQSYIITKAVKIRSTKEKPVTQYVLVNDLINYNSLAPLFTDPKLVKWYVHRAARTRQFYEKYRKREIIVNGHLVGELIGRLYSRVGIRHRQLQAYGPNKEEWLQALQKQFSRDVLPEEYGGFKGHVPIKLYPD